MEAFKQVYILYSNKTIECKIINLYNIEKNIR